MTDYLIREEMMFGAEAVQRLQGKHVIVFGIGGVGSFAVEGLARAGVGALTLVDNDTVGLSNLNRQLCALRSTLGQNKSDVMAARVLDINPDCAVRSLPMLYNEETKAAFFDRHYDYVIDAIDLVSCKLSLIVNARALGIPIISAMGAGNKLDPTAFEVADISQTSVCPLARVMRQELRKRGVEHLKVVYSREPARVPRQEESAEAPQAGRRSTPGSVSFCPSVAGLILAGEVVKDLSGVR